MLNLFTTIATAGKIYLLAAILLFLGYRANGQQQDTTAVPELETDRPDQTESASVIPLKAIQIETGLYFQRDKTGMAEISYTAYPTTLVRFGILKWLELRTEGTYQQLKVENEGQLKERGFGPLTLGAKAKLWQEDGLRPQTAILTMVDLPVGHLDFKPDNPEVEVRLLFKNTLTENLDLSYNLAYSWENDASVKGYSVSIARDLGDKVAVFGEVFGEKSSDQKAEHSVDAGIVFLALPNLQFDLAAGTALNSAAPDFFILTGVSVRLPR